MKISICIPVYGRAKMLIQALHSILLQEHEDYEVILRDDDPEHPVNISLPDSRFKYFVEPHLHGMSERANAVLRHATGDILYLMGSDDLLCPGALFAVNQAFESDRFGAAWLYGKTISTDSHFRFQGTDGAATTFPLLCEHNRIGQPSTFWNRAMMNWAGPFDTRYKYTGDYDMWLRFWRLREPIFLDQELGIYRHHDGNMATIAGKESTDAHNREADLVSWRHTYLGDLISRARNRHTIQKLYGGDIPPSHDG
jgi:glycosyltransferase involved in cell wall biosynthesis